MITHGTYILIDIDALFDTRLGTVALYDPKVALNLLNRPEYAVRLHDNFSEYIDVPDWDHEQYMLNYKHRNVATLSYSKPTGIVFGLKALCLETLKELHDNPEHEKIEVYLNINPYLDLTSSEIVDLRVYLKEYLPDFVKVKVINKSLEELTPMFMKPLFTHWITYAFNDWTAIHFNTDMSYDELVEKQNPHLKVIIPMLLKDHEQLSKFHGYIKETKGKHEAIHNPFLLLMVTFADTLELIPKSTGDFCCFLRKPA